jgi:hypothetical protein
MRTSTYLGRVEVTDRDGMRPGSHDPRAVVQRTEGLPGPSVVGGGARPPGSGMASAAR